MLCSCKACQDSVCGFTIQALWFCQFCGAMEIHQHHFGKENDHEQKPGIMLGFKPYPDRLCCPRSGTHTFTEVLDALEAAVRVRLRRLRVPAFVARLAGELGELKWTLTGKPQIISRRKVRDMLQERWTCCWDKAERELGYQPRVALADGMRQTAEWYAAEGWLKPLPAA